MEAEIAMDLSFWLTTITLGILAYAGFRWVNSAYIAPLRAARSGASEGQTVKRKPRLKGFRQRSPRSKVQNDVNAGSGQQEAESAPVNVQLNVQRSAQIAPAPAAPGGTDSSSGAFTLTTAELVHLTEAIHLRREGATVEDAVCRAFAVTKGGSEGYRRAKAIWDAANTAPGAAPAGTYAAPTAPKRRRRAVAAR
jgi:hypothetical protein